ncbi:TraR/DksA C4-type zinc finger protein [Acidithiobacillus ferrooxidans]|jgi:DnaK suppressor protein|uniref:TraR/DksA C4-type zinc finger protein n=1 Tax=Acidithiobacillus ferrooxidans TaxID=920 RepID=UPI00214B4CF7|nr:TraR/DksA C4-type zinc finger protein [Acidithiobacillus ferrooxidans]MCR2831816.1 TraR/DksA C4-type zinc finger protein [Acidithiobacillus ferrooxidans]
MIQGERLADEADVGAKNTEEYLLDALARQRAASVPQEEPDEDAEGHRYCLDCSEIIPLERIQAVQAVRCVTCATQRERFAKLSKGRGGAGRIMNDEKGFDGK